MLPTIPVNLKDRVLAALTNCDSAPWFPHLIPDLTRGEWRRLYEKNGITSSTYGTGRMVLNDAKAPHKTVYTLDIQDTNGKTKDEIFVELLPKATLNKYRELGVNFYTEEEFYANGRVHNEFLDCLSAAFDLIIEVPSLFETARCLVKAIHLIKADDDDYDVSFSEPEIPFSIFVSMPRKNTPINALRVAEAIIHEAMHLQLTLIENIVPLAVPGEELVYSPWKEEYRTPQGVLHAIYVFKVISKFLREIQIKQIDGNCLENYATARILTIKDQLNDIENDFCCGNSLTQEGIMLLKRL